MNHAETLLPAPSLLDDWIAVAPCHMPPADLVVVGWHDELESPVVVFYDITYDDEEGPRWSVLADGGEFPLSAISHWRYCPEPHTKCSTATG